MATPNKDKGSADTPRTVPEGYHTVTPFVIVKGAAQLISFMQEAFDATEITRVTGDDGAIGHAEVRIGDSVVMLFDSREDWPQTPAFLRLYVTDCDAAHDKAVKAGATSVTKPTSVPWGDRMARVGDPLGNLWWIMARMEDVSEEEIMNRYEDKEYIEAMEYVQSSEFFPLKNQATAQ